MINVNLDNNTRNEKNYNQITLRLILSLSILSGLISLPSFAGTLITEAISEVFVERREGRGR